MIGDRQVFEYPRSRKFRTLFIFCIALLLPILPAVIGFTASVLAPPRLEVLDALHRLFHFFPIIMERIPMPPLLIFLGLWIFFIVGALPKAIIYSLVITVKEQGIDASLFGLHVRHLPWCAVDRIEEATTLEYEGSWSTLRIVRIEMRNKRLEIRESILDFEQLLKLVRDYADRYQIPTRKIAT